MSRSYFEDLYLTEQRQSEWRMLNVALSERRGHAFRHSIVAAVFWIFGTR